MASYNVCNVGILNNRLVSFEVKAEAGFKPMRGSSFDDKSFVEMYFKSMSRGFWDCTVYFPDVTNRSISSITVVVREGMEYDSRDELVKSLVSKACKRITTEAKSIVSRAGDIINSVGGGDD